MSSVLDYLSQNGHTGNRVVQIVGGQENIGFLLAHAGTVQAPQFWAHYVDGVVEAINPPQGFPRPDPDPAVRTRRVALPATLQSFAATGYRHASRHTGQLRRVVQCLFSRGLESKFAWGWAKTHGILEYPSPRQVGASVAQEALNYALRRFWLVEISAAGVYAAPLDFGLDALNAARNLSDYLPTSAQLAANPSLEQYAAELSLAWAFANRNESGRVVRLVDSGAIAAVYGYGVWYPGMGWAFSVSGAKAANVVYREVSLPAPHYETRVARIALSVAFAGSWAEIVNLGGGVARVTLLGHGFEDGQLAVVSGAIESAYNGAHVVTVVSQNAFDFALAGNPSSPATGEIKVANAAGNATLSAAVSQEDVGRVTFKAGQQGVLWVPLANEIHRWQAVRPYYQGGSATLSCDGAVHVFFDGEDEVLTRWGATYSTFVPSQQLSPHPPPGFFNDDPDLHWNYETSWGMAQWNDTQNYQYVGPLCQNGGYLENYYPGHPCSVRYAPVVFGEGSRDDAGSEQSIGFTGAFNARKVSSSRARHTRKTEKVGGPERGNWTYQYSYGSACSSCGGASWGGQYRWANYRSFIRNTKRDFSESLHGGSSLVLLAEEREAVFGVALERTVRSGTQATVLANVLAGVRYEAVTATPFTDHDVPSYGPGFVYSSSSSAINEDSGNVYTLNLRASGGVAVSVFGAQITDDVQGFTYWQSQLHETHDSKLFFMRGGLAYPEASLAPADQRGNYLMRYETAELRGGNFAALGARTPGVFIGRV